VATDDYGRLEDALAAGAEPAMLCATCPWDRYCVTPPTMTKADVDEALRKATAEDDLRAQQARSQGKEPPLPMGGLLTAITTGSRHRTASICPVFALRLRSGRGRDIVDGAKVLMQGWDDRL
jgi:hypothetical protein